MAGAGAGWQPGHRGPHEFKVGSRVIVDHMTGASAKLNHMTGVITAWNETKEKRKVKVDANKQSYLLKPMNIVFDHSRDKEALHLAKERSERSADVDVNVSAPNPKSTKLQKDSHGDKSGSQKKTKTK